MSDRKSWSAVFALLFVGILGACGENVATSLGCPSLCSDASGVLRDTTLTASVVSDSSLLGYPRLGESRDLTLINRGDTADVRVIVRFDTLPATYLFPGTANDSLIRKVDSASLIFTVDTLSTVPTFPITVDAFDVDTVVADTLTGELVQLFRADRLIGSQTYQKGDFKDTVRLTLDNAKLFSKIRDTLDLRIGLRVRSASGPAQLKMLAATFSPIVRFRVSSDTTVRPDTLHIASFTPKTDDYIAINLQVYPLIVKGALVPPKDNILVVGGIAGARSYLKFDIPASLIDSAQIVRASLLLNQVPGRLTGRTSDTVTVFTHPIVASPGITDLRTLFGFIGSPSGFGIDSVRIRADESGLRSIELVNLLRFWSAIGVKNTSRSVVLRAKEEASLPGELSFVSIEGASALRPRLRITYVPRRGFGIP